MFVRKYLSEGRYHETVLLGTETHQFLISSGRELLQNTPKHHFGSNGGCWMCSCEKVRPKFLKILHPFG